MWSPYCWSYSKPLRASAHAAAIQHKRGAIRPASTQSPSVLRTLLTPKHPNPIGFVPTLDKFGKTCQLLLGPQDVYFIQTGVNTDGVHVTARLSRDTLFEEEGFLISSRTNDNIAFSFEVANLLRVLRGSSANGADLLEIKLAMRSVAVGGAAATASKPFLTFTSRVRATRWLTAQAGSGSPRWEAP
mmetsp:Transcript_37394/g.94509  ORF Transcript_37394/g.94509 Transcript_37394/m.94509 type:complete len:187 (-) Transcript_37394:55-615(-)